MRISVLAASFACVVALAGCSSAAAQDSAQQDDITPQVEDAPVAVDIFENADDEAFIAQMVPSMPPGADTEDSRAAVLEMGYTFCEWASDGGITTDEAAQGLIDGMDTSDPNYMLMMGTALLAGKHSGELLCPGL